MQYRYKQRIQCSAECGNLSHGNVIYASRLMGLEHFMSCVVRSYCIGLFLAPLIQSLAENHCNFLLYRMGTCMRNSLMAAIYRKCLRLSSSSLQAESTGR